jgi:hypothetical protein
MFYRMLSVTITSIMLNAIMLMCRYADLSLCWCVVMLNVIMPNIVMLNVVMLNVVMLNVVMLNVIMLNVIMLNVVMLMCRYAECHYAEYRGAIKIWMQSENSFKFSVQAW